MASITGIFPKFGRWRTAVAFGVFVYSIHGSSDVNGSVMVKGVDKCTPPGVRLSLGRVYIYQLPFKFHGKIYVTKHFELNISCHTLLSSLRSEMQQHRIL